MTVTRTDDRQSDDRQYHNDNSMFFWPCIKI